MIKNKLVGPFISSGCSVMNANILYLAHFSSGNHLYTFSSKMKFNISICVESNKRSITESNQTHYDNPGALFCPVMFPCCLILCVKS